MLREQCPHSARTVPAQCPYSARTVPDCKNIGFSQKSRKRKNSNDFFFNDTTENYTKHYVFTIGHCAGHCTGTVRALCGHCTGTVEASKTCDVAAWAKFSDCLEAAIWFTRHVIPCQAARQDSLLRPSNQTRISDSPLSSLHRVALDSTFDECSRDC